MITDHHNAHPYGLCRATFATRVTARPESSTIIYSLIKPSALHPIAIWTYSLSHSSTQMFMMMPAHARMQAHTNKLISYHISVWQARAATFQCYCGQPTTYIVLLCSYSHPHKMLIICLHTHARGQARSNTKLHHTTSVFR